MNTTPTLDLQEINLGRGGLAFTEEFSLPVQSHDRAPEAVKHVAAKTPALKLKKIPPEEDSGNFRARALNDYKARFPLPTS